ncbi:TAF6-like RNA polymerase II p300/CBP-associated factor-associated factor 65 kDa subunit 6L [Dendronephthya gigantea]|uniref:TAF6-like RNA polymerase II p300/CBP-associated factor-associated factor 65 kDa subunit 6L n=1 Tax=Dendronephthya gigantea TaxID=151771 RepID=UPI00106BE44F|nr:TAF6-like RNA polymerase II p300/CBP-associated factor-associated factor 65 kDa subunit 6L [Dendronephthya gigantea]
MAKRTGLTGVENQFCVVPRKSIKLLGESVGIGYLSSEVAATLAEDSSYRIRQIVKNANQFVHHSKRDHMTGEDINRALFWSHVEPIYGYGSKNSNIFSSISTKDGDLFFHEDKEINLRELAFSKGFSSLNELGSSDINVEVSVLDKKVVKSDGQAQAQGDNQQSAVKHPEFDSLKPVLKTYYNQVMRNIITGNDKAVKVILTDVKTNQRGQILLPYFVHFLTTAMQSLDKDIPKLLRIFDFIKALVDNKHLYLKPYVVELVRAAMFCLIEKPVSKVSASWIDDWALRNRAALTLCHIDRKCNNAGNLLHLQLLRNLKDIYHATDRPLHSQYGAITGLAMLGDHAIEQTIFPHMKEFCENLRNLQEKDVAREELIQILHILEILKISTMSIFRAKLRTIATLREKQFQIQKTRGNATNTPADKHSKLGLVDQTPLNKEIIEWYRHIYTALGDAFVLLLGNVEDYENFTMSKLGKVTRPGRSMLNQSRLQYIRKMIQTALENRMQTVPSSFAFSLQGEKERMLSELSVSTETGQTKSSYLNPYFLDREKSEFRFQNLLENSRPKHIFKVNRDTCRLPSLGQGRTSFDKKPIALLSLPL